MNTPSIKATQAAKVPVKIRAINTPRKAVVKHKAGHNVPSGDFNVFKKKYVPFKRKNAQGNEFIVRDEHGQWVYDVILVKIGTAKNMQEAKVYWGSGLVLEHITPLKYLSSLPDYGPTPLEGTILE